ncbi:uncharacterized protein LOC141905197 isoform X2 [Tubulanus polymorphus]|uniref:uncharacterized protein LOC141905197 isoform X2 n=1 Tax=Tubulanus polymorphus TaxID=672921 RepID=UPI003DA4B0CB
MASSSVSQESLDKEDFEPTRRSRMRILRGRSSSHVKSGGGGDSVDMAERGTGGDQNGADCDFHHQYHHDCGGGGGGGGGEHESPTRLSRMKDKRGRPNHLHKGKNVKDKRKLREKRRSTGVVHIPSTESTGDSLDDDEETKRNTSINELLDDDDQFAAEDRVVKQFVPRRNKSPSDLEADLEDNQDYDSTVSQSETNLTMIGQCLPCAQYRPAQRGGRSPDPARMSLNYNRDGETWQTGGHNSRYRERRPEADAGKSVHFSQRSQPPYSGVSSSCKDGDSGDSKMSSSNSSEGKNPPLSRAEELEKILQHERLENQHLKQIIEDKDKRISELEKQLNSIIKHQ